LKKKRAVALILVSRKAGGLFDSDDGKSAKDIN